MFPSPLSLINTFNWKDIGKKALLILLLPVFFIVKGYDENFGLIPLRVLAGLLLIYSLVSLGIFGISLILLWKTSKAFIFSIYLLAVFFFFGAFYDFAKKIFHQGIITSYTFLLLLILISIVGIFFVLKRMKKNGTRVITYYKWLMGIFIIGQFISLCYHLFGSHSSNNLAGKTVPIATTMSCPHTAKPDIYFVVLDGYTSSKCLKEEFAYSNKSIDSLLKSNHFFISLKSRSNYNVTPFSLSSTLDMDYLKPGIEKEPVSSKVFLQAMETLRNNDLTRFFKQQGYLIRNYGCFDFNDAPSEKKPYFQYAVYNQVDNQTIWSRIKKDIGWNITTRNIFTGKFRIPERYAAEKKYHLERNQYNWSRLIDELKKANDTPRLVYVHVMLPHEPFYLKRDGSMASDTAIVRQTNNLKEGYLDQLIYANGLLKEVIQLASAHSARERVVIFEGDHGFRDYEGANKRPKEFMNLNTYYFSDHDYRGLYDSISPVNSFRVILNKYFCQKLPLLKDSSIYLINNTKYF